ncbi:MAG: glycosyltransferase family 9 protein [Thermodesulfobacteriota bacterium]|nr:glycosyltransferase family 9 protein [Thermodesulfobacteriota bacterium]
MSDTKRIIDQNKTPVDWNTVDRVVINLVGEWIGLGDVIALSPLVSAIRSASRKCKIHLILTGSKWNQIVNLMEGNTKTINVENDFYRFRKLWLYGLFRFRRPWLKTAYFYDYMAPRYRASLLGYIIGAKFRFGYGKKGPNKEEKPTHNTHILPANSSKGIDPFYYSKDFYNITGLEYAPRPCFNKDILSNDGKRLIDSLGVDQNKRVVAIHPGSSLNLKAKRWPIESFIRLRQKLNSKYEINTLVILGPDDSELYLNWPDDSNVFFIENYSIYDIAAILSCCECLISNDSGIMNLGFSIGILGVGLFGPTNSAMRDGLYPNSILIQSQYNSACPSCYGTNRYVECAKIPTPCMESITIDEVLEKIEELLLKCAE